MSEFSSLYVAGIVGSLASQETAARLGRNSAHLAMLVVIGTTIAAVIPTTGSFMVASLMLRGFCAGAVLARPPFGWFH
jgi:hypothetical protein